MLSPDPRQPAAKTTGFLSLLFDKFSHASKSLSCLALRPLQSNWRRRSPMRAPTAQHLGVADCPRQLLDECSYRFGKEKRSVLQVPRFGIIFHFWNWGFASLSGIWCLGFGIYYCRQRPWPKIIHQDQATAIRSSAVALHPAGICERAKLESAAQAHEEIVRL